MKRTKMFVAITTMALLLLLFVGLIIVVVIVDHRVVNKETEQFYIGVTYCGSSVEEAKELIDRVEEYTNLFVLQSGTLQNATAVDEIGDYVIALGLSFAVYTSENVYYGNSAGSGINVWANAAKERWKEQFIGIYYRDEPGGDLLAGKLAQLTPKISKQGDTITITNRGEDNNNNYSNSSQNGEVVSSQVIYRANGEIFVRNFTDSDTMGSFAYLEDGTVLLGWGSSNALHYYPDGTVTIGDINGDFYTTENITKYPQPIQPYEQILKQKPIQTPDDAANAFVNMNKNFFGDINKKQLNSESITVFTADYGLYWWNYKSGYDLVLAELAWNHSITQEIALLRGAANLQNKQWGTMITWKYTHAPYLTDGEEMFEQMKTSYETGANYVIIFNYSEDPANPNTLQEEHFQALERFWKQVVQNPQISHGGIKAETVLVLPKNYGCAMRSPNDPTWGLWPADNTSQKIWSQIQNKTDQYGLKLDIIFEDPNYPPLKYNQIHYWNQK
ncbi:MAG: hypothetical protein FWD52_01100 [Candidatus Bathyarchaeota archaeon]|nr:hypothetical protein [Candidatus Termiticorpusculum sp.]